MEINSCVGYAVASLLLLFPCLCVLRIFTGKSLGSKEYPPVKGTMFRLLRCLDSLYDYQAEVAAHNKTVRYLAFSQSEVYTADPQNIEYILKTNFANYDKVTNMGHLLSSALFLVFVARWLFEAKLLSGDDDSMSNQWWTMKCFNSLLLQGAHHQEITKDLLGDGIFAVDGQRWRHQRKVASYEFSTKVLRDFSSVVFRSNAAVLARKISDKAEANMPMDIHGAYHQEITKDPLGDASYEFSTKVLRDFSSIVFRRNAAVLAQKISQNADADLPMDIHELFTKYSMDSIFEVGFGLKLNILEGSNEEAIRFAKAFDESNALTFYRYVNLFWKVKRFFNVGSEATLRKNIAVIDEFIYKIISSRLEAVFPPSKSSPIMTEITHRHMPAHQMILQDILSRFLWESEKNPETMNDSYLRDIILNL
ncbi:hypothetical protein EJ110_NYTH50709 [Nymphaea thermarum]|nr:hypothetical protein EJ110_NYTH50709 [Nymphaea thermarum]